MKGNLIKDKSILLAIRIIKLSKYIQETKNEFILTKQLIRSGTSIGANIHEGDFAESKADFIHKLSIAQKECSETLYWIELLKETSYLNTMEYDSIYNDSIEVMKLLTSILKTAKKNLYNNGK